MRVALSTDFEGALVDGRTASPQSQGSRMAVRAYVLIQTDVGLAADITVEVRRLPGVSSADGVTGPYDVIACVEVDDIDALGRMVVSRVQMIDGITRTLTCPVVTL